LVRLAYLPQEGVAAHDGDVGCSCMRPAAEQRCGGNLPSSRPGNPVRCRASVLAGSVCGCAVKRWAARRRTSWAYGRFPSTWCAWWTGAADP